VLELTGPAELIDAVERSLFAVGAVACRIDADDPGFRENPQLLGVVADAQVQSGLIALVSIARDQEALTASAGGFDIALDADNRMHAVTEVLQLLRRAGIFISSEGADL
jgi:hypothetical protein